MHLYSGPYGLYQLQRLHVAAGCVRGTYSGYHVIALGSAEGSKYLCNKDSGFRDSLFKHGSGQVLIISVLGQFWDTMELDEGFRNLDLRTSLRWMRERGKGGALKGQNPIRGER